VELLPYVLREIMNEKPVCSEGMAPANRVNTRMF